jgi:predicted N-formylglutamate amidohydrolase
MKNKNSTLVFTCEHGGNKVPSYLSSLFKNSKSLLESHRGFDPGALEMAKSSSEKLGVPLFYEQITRLVVEQNRSRTNRGVFSEFTKTLSQGERESLLEEIYDPYHKKVITAIESVLKTKRNVIHVSFHSFTPVLDGEVRNADIGLLYNPSRRDEKLFCDNLTQYLSERSKLKIRRNYPYRGTSDGFTTALRKQYGDSVYCGIEIELNQKHFLNKSEEWSFLLKTLPDAIAVCRDVRPHVSTTGTGN